ncbi:unnamed protein product [Ectocarpus sp. 8 AP-2014]
MIIKEPAPRRRPGDSRNERQAEAPRRHEGEGRRGERVAGERKKGAKLRGKEVGRQHAAQQVLSAAAWGEDGRGKKDRTRERRGGQESEEERQRQRRRGRRENRSSRSWTSCDRIARAGSSATTRHGGETENGTKIGSRRSSGGGGGGGGGSGGRGQRRRTRSTRHASTSVDGNKRGWGLQPAGNDVIGPKTRVHRRGRGRSSEANAILRGVQCGGGGGVRDGGQRGGGGRWTGYGPPCPVEDGGRGPSYGRRGATGGERTSASERRAVSRAAPSRYPSSRAMMLPVFGSPARPAAQHFRLGPRSFVTAVPPAAAMQQGTGTLSSSAAFHGRGTGTLSLETAVAAAAAASARHASVFSGTGSLAVL